MFTNSQLFFFYFIYVHLTKLNVFWFTVYIYDSQDSRGRGIMSSIISQTKWWIILSFYIPKAYRKGKIWLFALERVWSGVTITNQISVFLIDNIWINVWIIQIFLHTVKNSRKEDIMTSFLDGCGQVWLSANQFPRSFGQHYLLN